MEKGFFHPDQGYWQTNGDPPDWILANYPEGTIEVPVKPGPDHEWDGNQWVHTPSPVHPSEVNAERDRRTLEGASFEITNYGSIRIQGDETTQKFLEARGTAAKLSLLAGEDLEFVWRDADNNIHTLTATQMVELYQKGAGFVEAVRIASWQLKDRELIPEDFEDDKYWP
ncbi:DUF4376 domain-containing protein [Epibacterium sp. MM17-32]|uniref:DUF4376 domain-containing protein n=1 Tax=Epibacterium sp. MM17-32 TaxID=2917734 RepID=UPI001EF4213A|nr:DUF4376 domain-containing protein [Epibacterium sp. MM17-32]MCG7628982.1 DUF4376 domain-containing protein [Epibacterium sp. MM17-32]